MLYLLAVPLGKWIWCSMILDSAPMKIEEVVKGINAFWSKYKEPFKPQSKSNSMLMYGILDSSSTWGVQGVGDVLMAKLIGMIGSNDAL
ncbi:hypothetical protein RJT34_16248 [Clitoria ternatea]|uniref:Uncharacterized protein n=1 Tax=Clitoria ternatea TaxID=43366 RepID=A0AAN9J8U9_CLITE